MHDLVVVADGLVAGNGWFHVHPFRVGQALRPVVALQFGPAAPDPVDLPGPPRERQAVALDWAACADRTMIPA
jgi:hypothetical protein